MSSQGLRDLLEAYAESHDPAFFAEEGVLAVPPFGLLRGREAITVFLRFLFDEAFSHAWIDPRRTIVEGEQRVAVIESTFKARIADAGAGTVAPGRIVTVPLVEVVEFRNGQIVAVWLYWNTGRLLEAAGVRRLPLTWE